MPETNFFWDPDEDNIIQERDETGAITAEYTTEPGLYGNLISQNRDGIESQYHFDSQGSTLALTDDNQNVTDTYAYTFFGELIDWTGSTGNPFQYLGRNYFVTNGFSGDYLAHNLVYSPIQGGLLCLEAIWTGFAGYIDHRVYDPDGLDSPVLPAELKVPPCKADETACIQDAIRLATDTIRRKFAECFVKLRLCPNGTQSACSPDILGQCLLDILAKSKIGRAHV